MSVNVRLKDNNRCTYPKVRGSKSVRCGGSGCGGGGGVGEVSVDISEQVAHHCWHTGTHVLGGQTGEVPGEGNKQLLFLHSIRGIEIAMFEPNRMEEFETQQ